MRTLEKVKYELALKEFYERTKDHVPLDVLTHLAPVIKIIHAYGPRYSSRTFLSVLVYGVLVFIIHFIGNIIASYLAIYVLQTVFRVQVDLSLGNAFLIAIVVSVFRVKFSFKQKG